MKKYQKKTTNLRVVFDRSSEPDVDSSSINECLEKAPNLVLLLLSTGIKNHLSQHQKEDADVNQLLKDFFAC